MAIFNFLARNGTILANFTAAVTFLLHFGKLSACFFVWQTKSKRLIEQGLKLIINQDDLFDESDENEP